MNRGTVKVQERDSTLTSGTTKLMAISSQERRSKTWELLEGVLVGVLGALEQCRRQEGRVGAVE